MDQSEINMFKSAKDIKSGLIVSLVALPLCLGISIASGAPMLSGLIAGIVGGIIVGLGSNSSLSVSGPAAGLTIIIVQGIQEVGSFQLLLPAIVLAGMIQIILGYFKAGEFTEYIPHSVIEGMMASIGLLLITKQIPFLIGHTNYDDLWGILKEPEKHYRHIGAILIGISSMCFYFIARRYSLINRSIFKNFPFPLFIITVASLLAYSFKGTLLELPSFDYVRISEFLKSYHPEGFYTELRFSNLFNPIIIKFALIISIVASIESLLSIEASDNLDPKKNITDKNRELKAQGFGNTLSGLLGGLPITSVVVRTSVNAQSGADSKKSTIFHGLYLLIFITLAPNLIEKFPLSALAAILIFTGYNLAHPRLFKDIFSNGIEQFAPFIITILGVLFSDLLRGVALGFISSIFFALKDHYHLQNKLLTMTIDETSGISIVSFGPHLTFINKKNIKRVLNSIAPNSKCILDFSKTHFIDFETKELILHLLKERNHQDIEFEVSQNQFISLDITQIEHEKEDLS